ncbi:MAG: PilZ domain-containing protein [Hyphomicrobiaceae bacterium]|nr:MAG: PilZ domain-containing protein [Hyphomicrobiaceae bacterium]
MQLPPIELDFLLSQEKLAFGAEPVAQPRSGLSPAESQRLLVLVRNELQSQAFLVSAVGSLVNRIAAGIDQDADVLLAYLPPEAHSTIALLDKLIGCNLPAAVLGDLQEVVSRLESARTMTKAFCGERRQASIRGGVHVEVLAGAWQDLAECAAALLRTLAEHTASPGDASGSTQMTRVVSMLIDVANGRSPCVKADCSVEIPGWAERRREPRWFVDWAAEISASGGFAPVRILNISQSGICLSTELPLRHLETVSIEAGRGRRMPGQVMWSKGSRHGIRLFMSLADTDPLIAAAKTGLDTEKAA